MRSILFLAAVAAMGLAGCQSVDNQYGIRGDLDNQDPRPYPSYFGDRSNGLKSDWRDGFIAPDVNHVDTWRDNQCRTQDTLDRP